MLSKRRKIQNRNKYELTIFILFIYFNLYFQINHYRNVNNITVVGRHVPEPCKSFNDFNVDEDIIENLKTCGFEEPTPIQKQAVPLMLEVNKTV